MIELCRIDVVMDFSSMSVRGARSLAFGKGQTTFH